MTIIAKTNNGFVIQADEHEVARLAGYYSASDCRSRLVIGAEIKVNAMFEQLYKLRYIARNIKEIEAQATNLLDAIKIKDPIIAPIVAAIGSAAPKDEK